MSRRRKIILPDTPHHVVQRGVRKMDVFFEDCDREVYLNIFAKYAAKYGTEVLSYCLMKNHVHFMLVPNHEESLRWTMQIAQKRYADYINAKSSWTGNLWESRFYCSPIDEEYFWITLRYIERNPVKAGVVQHPADFKWSSALAHCSKRDDDLLTNSPRWAKLLAGQKNWYQWLQEKGEKEKEDRLKHLTSKDLPCGSEAFLDKIEGKMEVSARPARLGRPKKKVGLS